MRAQQVIAIIALVLCIVGIAMSLIGRILLIKHRRRIDKTLANYAEYQKRRDLKYPEMVGKWGKP